MELLYETRVWHVGHLEQFMLLEAQMTGWVPDDPDADSPDRMDALVWVVSELVGNMNRRRARPAVLRTCECQSSAGKRPGHRLISWVC